MQSTDSSTAPKTALSLTLNFYANIITEPLVTINSARVAGTQLTNQWSTRRGRYVSYTTVRRDNMRFRALNNGTEPEVSHNLGFHIAKFVHATVPRQPKY